jgi:hypothetical protein
MSDASPFINAVPVHYSKQLVSDDFERNKKARLTKREYDRQEKLKRDPLYKKTGKES